MNIETSSKEEIYIPFFVITAIKNGKQVSYMTVDIKSIRVVSDAILIPLEDTIQDEYLAIEGVSILDTDNMETIIKKIVKANVRYRRDKLKRDKIDTFYIVNIQYELVEVTPIFKECLSKFKELYKETI